jgi:dGTPase
MTDWIALLNKNRRRVSRSGSSTRIEGRTEFERDFDRILFSTPVRRMADKTQVFPLESHDAIHTRLTHSHEVSVLARSMGLDLVSRFGEQLGMPTEDPYLSRDVSALMAAVGLVHDIGNPPFGHEGEAAIARWFRDNPEIFNGEPGLPLELRQDFRRFEGNAQTLRLVTRLQLQGDEYGLNLTYGTLAVLLKYTVAAHEAKRDSIFAGGKKPGFFKSEESIVDEVWERTGLKPAQRHPLAYLVEACDDICYGVIDVEDTVKKDLASYADVYSLLLDTCGADKVAADVLKYCELRRSERKSSLGGSTLSPKELDDLSMQTFRVAAISEMVRAALDTFVANVAAINDGTFEKDLIQVSLASTLSEGLRTFREKVTFPHRSVLRIELIGWQTISQLMTKLWTAITTRVDRAIAKSEREDRLSAYTYSLISENYRRVFETADDSLPIVYREAQLLCDMISGMTDTFAVSLLKELNNFEA